MMFIKKHHSSLSFLSLLFILPSKTKQQSLISWQIIYVIQIIHAFCTGLIPLCSLDSYALLRIYFIPFDEDRNDLLLNVES